MANIVTYRYENTERALSLFNSNGCKKSRLHVFDYTGEKGKDCYALAAEKIQFTDGKTPALGWLNKKYYVLHAEQDEDGATTWYKININSLKKRFNITSKELKTTLDKKTGVATGLESLFIGKKDAISNQLLSAGSVVAALPKQQLLENSIQIKVQDRQFNDWTQENHSDSYFFMQRIAQAWKKNQMTDQYMIFGKVDSNDFNWEVVPYKKCHTVIGRIAQQLKVLSRIVFGGKESSEKSIEKQNTKYQQLLTDEMDYPDESESVGNDPFCKEETMDRQRVIEGETVNVLYNYAPIGFGGERLHFLVIPKAHRSGFTDVTKEEYCESMELTKKLIDHFSSTRTDIKNAYILNKTGVDAGQSVDHWHLHVILSNNGAQDSFGKLTVMKNILLGSSPMSKEALAAKVSDLKDELGTL